MATINNVTLKGNITQDLEIKRIGQSNLALCRIPMGISNYAKKAGQLKPEAKPCYIEVICWGDMAERVSQFKKGEQIIVSGQLWMDTWQDKQTGANRNKHWIKPTCVEAVKKTEQPPAPQQQAPQQFNNEMPFGY